MKLGARIEGSKVHRVGYRLFLANRAIDIDLPGFSAQNRIEGGRQVLLAFIEGDESQVGEFKRFMEFEKPPEAEVSSITFQDYQGTVGDTMLFHQKMSSQHLGKGIDAILRMEKKQDLMLEKQDMTISVLKEVKEDTSSIRNDISEFKKETMDTILEKYLELSREIAEMKATLSEIKAKASRKPVNPQETRSHQGAGSSIGPRLPLLYIR